MNIKELLEEKKRLLLEQKELDQKLEQLANNQILQKISQNNQQILQLLTDMSLSREYVEVGAYNGKRK